MVTATPMRRLTINSSKSLSYLDGSFSVMVSDHRGEQWVKKKCLACLFSFSRDLCSLCTYVLTKKKKKKNPPFDLYPCRSPASILLARCHTQCSWTSHAHHRLRYQRDSITSRSSSTPIWTSRSRCVAWKWMACKSKSKSSFSFLRRNTRYPYIIIDETH